MAASRSLTSLLFSSCDSAEDSLPLTRLLLCLCAALALSVAHSSSSMSEMSSSDAVATER
jgi:hypothetical protein